MKRSALLMAIACLLLALTSCAGMENWPESKDSPVMEHESPRP